MQLRFIFSFMMLCLCQAFVKAQPLIPSHFAIGFKSGVFPGKNSVTSLGFLLAGQFDFSPRDIIRVNAGYSFGHGKNFAYVLSDPDHYAPDSSILSDYKFMHLSWNVFYQRFLTGNVEDGGWYVLGGPDLYMFSVTVRDLPEKYVGANKKLDVAYIPGALCLGGGGYVPLGVSGCAFFSELTVSFPFSQKKFGNSGLPFENVSASLTLGLVFPYKGYGNY